MFREAHELMILPAGGGRLRAEVAAGVQPFQAMYAGVVGFFPATDDGLDRHPVAGVRAQNRRKRITGPHVIRQRQIRGVAHDGIERRQCTVDAGLQGKGQVTSQSRSLHAGFAVGADTARIVNTEAHRFVAVVHDKGADVVERDHAGTGARHAAGAGRCGAAQVRKHRFGFDHDRRIDRVAVGIGSRRRRGLAIGADADIHVLFIGMLEVGKLEEKFAVAVVLAIAIQIAGENHRLP